jgi:hypothetical protein
MSAGVDCAFSNAEQSNQQFQSFAQQGMSTLFGDIQRTGSEPCYAGRLWQYKDDQHSHVGWSIT